MKKPCSECPYFVESNNNKIIKEFSIKNNKKHNCHKKKGNIWELEESKRCVGNEKHIN